MCWGLKQGVVVWWGLKQGGVVGIEKGDVGGNETR